MLHLLRRAAKTWVFRGLFALLIVSFAVWGIGDLSLGGAGDRVAQVGERRITVQDYGTALSREINALARRAQRPISVEEAREAGIPDALLARIIRDAALDEEARRLGLSATDEDLRAAILDSPSFQGLDGSFDPESYRFILDRLGFTVERFETDLRRSLARDAVARGVASGAPAAPGLAEALVAREFERRAFAVLALPLADAPAPAPATESELRAFHEANAERYRAPELRETVWLEIDPETLAESVEIPEADLRAAYEAAAARFDRPERRVIDRLGFPDAAAAEAALERLAAGETTFADLVAERGLAPDDVSEGEVTRADLSAPAAEAVFAADEPGPLGPVETALGPALYNLRAVLPAATTPFAEARAELRDELARERAYDVAVARAEAAADLLASGAGLEAIAAETGLPLRSAALAETPREGGPADVPPEVRAEAFDAAPGEERDLVETEAGGYVLVRVDGIAEARTRPYVEVRETVAEDLAAERRRESLRDAAEAAVADLAGGTPLETVAETLGARPERTEPLRRAEAGSRPDLPARAVRDLFAAGAPGAAAYGETPEGLAVLALTGITPADLSAPPAAGAVGRIERALSAGVQDDLYAYYAAAVQARVGASVDEAAVRRTLDSLR